MANDRMVGPVQRGERNVLWASRARDAMSVPRTSRHSSQPGPNDMRGTPRAKIEEDDGTTSDPKTPGSTRDLNTAPAEMGQPHRQMSVGPVTRSSTLPGQEFELDPQAPLRAVRTEVTSGGMPTTGPMLMGDEEHEEGADADTKSQQEREDTWGDCFKVEWLCTERLPFYWTRNLRNPWNHDREVKISRDGTELEPTVGEMLLNTWEVMRESGGEIPPGFSGSNNGTRRGGHARRQTAGGNAAVESAPKGSTRS